MDTKEIIKNLRDIVTEELLPNVAGIAVQDFGRINDTLIASSKYLEQEPKDMSEYIKEVAKILNSKQTGNKNIDLDLIEITLTEFYKFVTK